MKVPAFPLVFCLAALALGVTARADDVLPQPAPAKRYEKLAAHSPFAPPSAGPAPVAPSAPPPGPTWSDNLTVTSLMQVHGVYTATVVAKDAPTKYFVRSDVEDRESHLMVASVRWADQPEDIKVTLRKGTQFGDVHFDPAGSSGGSVASNGPLPPPGRARPNNSAQAFHAPPLMPPMPSTAGPAGGPANTVVRGRPIIRSAPLPGPLPGRPAVSRQPVSTRPALPGKGGKDDDDDDDDDN